MTTTTVIHGSALASPTTARDVDVIFAGDRDEALRAARAWADARGIGHLPLDVHEAAGRSIAVPRVPGAAAPFEVIAGDLPVEHRECRGVASLIRAPLSAEAAHAAITAGFRVRVALVSPPRGDEWAGYVDGPRALASAIHRARVEGRWDALVAQHPALYRCLAAVAVYGAGKIPAETLDAITSGGGGGAARGTVYVDAFLSPQFGGDGLDRPLICSTHAREGAPCWRSFDALTQSIAEGAPAEAVRSAFVEAAAAHNAVAARAPAAATPLRDAEDARVADDRATLERRFAVESEEHERRVARGFYPSGSTPDDMP